MWWKWLVVVLLDWFKDRVWPQLYKWAAVQLAKLRRNSRQKEAGQKADQDVAEKKPRDEKTRENELSDINS